MDTSKFKMIDDNFICNVCGKSVDKLGYTARDHCPFCLSSIHVDNNPGDRMANCHGILVPIAIENTKNQSYKIVYKCSNCNVIKKNKIANDDDMDIILKIMSNPNKY